MKQCRYCKTENDDQAIQCAGCGLSLAFTEESTVAQGNEQVAQEMPAPKPKKKKLLPAIIASAAVLVLAVILLVVFLSQNTSQAESKFMFADTTLWTAVNASETEATLVVDTEVVGEPLDVHFPYPYSGTCSLDATVQILHDPDRGAYVVTKDGYSYLGETDYYAVAISGKGIVYRDEADKLYLQTVPLQEEPLLLCEKAGRFAISPDGQTVAYVKEEAEESVLYVYHEGTHTKIASDLRAVAISDDGQYIYCSSISGMAFYLADLSGNVTELAAGPWSFFVLNQDHTQLIYCGDGDWYVVDHGEKIKISDLKESTVISAEVYMVTPYGAAAKDVVYGSVITYGVENLAGNYYINTPHGELCYVDENWEAHAIAGLLTAMTTYGLSRDGSTLCYVEENTLYQVKNGDAEHKEQLAQNVIDYAVTSDGKAVYYLDDQNALWYQEGTGKAEKIANSVQRLHITHDNYLLFLTTPFGEPGDLYAVKNGSDPKQIADRVEYVVIASNATYYLQVTEEGDYTHDLYGTKKGTNFRFVTKDSW